MKFIKFEIKNFKGINELTLDLNKLPHGKIFPLVGLNESGKTTILEAINLFQNSVQDGFEHKLMHKNKKGYFNGDVEIKATLKLDNFDESFIKEFLKTKRLKQEDLVKNISITERYEFSEGKFVKHKPSSWEMSLQVIKQGKNYVDMYDKYNPDWNVLTTKIKDELIPKILYFENFLFDFPDKIYLEELPNSELTRTETQKEYRAILQDILSSIDDRNYDLNTHILSKIKDPTGQNEEAVRQVINDMCKKLNSSIIKSWQGVFNTKKEIEIDYKKDLDKYYLQFKIKKGGSSFSINEESLGFRWFFGFLLFTEFRKAREDENGEYLFLFDEPANNLHQKSQQKLLKEFEKITDKSKILYSTHSHHLLNPKFLLSTFVVKDEGKKENKKGEIDWDNYSQDIKAEPYRSFVADNLNEETHFQPLLDCLEYVESPFEKTNNMVFFEGKSDYYTFKWIKEQYFSDKDYNFNLYAGASVDKYKNIFREYLANNKKFVAVFDDDGKNGNGGIGAKERYTEEISEELRNNIFTLKDINENFAGFCTEGLFFVKKNDDKLKIQKLVNEEDDSYDKKRFNKAIQICFIKGEKPKLMKNTLNNFEAVFNFIQQKFKELDK